MTHFRTTVKLKGLQQVEVPPEKTEYFENGICFLDFGKAAFGTLLLPPKTGGWVVHLGEKLNAEGRLDRDPPGCIRYVRIEQAASPGENTRIRIPTDQRNTGPGAIRMPEEIGEVFPFRYAEIEGSADLDPSAVRQIRVHYPFDEEASDFESSDSVLNAVWEICRYTIKATTYCGVYVDGDRERIPYEGDAYINQLGHYGVDREYEFARFSHEYLIQHPTWPTEWQFHSVMMAWADYLYSGETESLQVFYEDLCVKTLIDLAREDGLISTETECCIKDLEKRLHFYGETYIFDHGLRDLVDWPPGSFTDGGTGERDNHEMLPVNTVVNAFHAHALKRMSHISGVLGKTGQKDHFLAQSEKVGHTINQILFDRERGIYVDGEGSQHASLHSNMFMLAFDLVPEARKASVIKFVKSRGMACSVYAAQFLLEALYLNGEDQYALELMTAQHDRGWWNMIRAGSTMTLEAWDLKYKKNLDWNHAWGAAPTNIIPRYLLGVRPLEPGFTKVLIQPQPGTLKQVSGKIPTPHGPILVSYQYKESGERILHIEIPGAIQARIGLRADPRRTYRVLDNGIPVKGVIENGFLYVENWITGTHELVTTDPA